MAAPNPVTRLPARSKSTLKVGARPSVAARRDSRLSRSGVVSVAGIRRPSGRPRIERVPPCVQVGKLAVDLLSTLERAGDRGCGFLVERRIRDRAGERVPLGL